MQRHWFKVFFCASVVGGAAGCAPILPPAVMIASQAIDGISYITTGKSGTDHILSAALSEDCAIHRVVTGGAICQAEPAGDIAAASDPKDSSPASESDGAGDDSSDDRYNAGDGLTAGNDSSTVPRPAGDSILPGGSLPGSDDAWDANLARVPGEGADRASGTVIPSSVPSELPTDDDSASLPLLGSSADHAV